MAALLLGCSGGGAERRTVSGTLTVQGAYVESLGFRDGDACSKDDIKDGAQLVVHDGARKLIGSTDLTNGEVQSGACRFTFAVDVGEADFYTFTVGSRQGVNYTGADLSAAGYQVTMELR